MKSLYKHLLLDFTPGRIEMLKKKLVICYSIIKIYFHTFIDFHPRFCENNLSIVFQTKTNTRDWPDFLMASNAENIPIW